MTALAAAENPHLVASDAEVLRPGPSYMVDTLRLLKGEHPAVELVLILGTDAAAEIGSWKSAAELRSLARVAVAARPGGPETDLPEALEIPGPTLDLSATRIRERVRSGLSVRHLVASGVADYICKRRLYS